MDNSVVVCGQVFPRAILKRINVAVRDHPEWSRADLARQVCQWLDWRGANGRDKAMACRVALVRLERRGLIERVRGLPDDRRAVVLRLTPAGQTLYRALKARAVGGIAELLSDSTPEERAALVAGLAALGRGLDARCTDPSSPSSVRTGWAGCVGEPDRG